MQQVHLGNSIKNDMWITEEEDESTPDVLPELPGFHVLVRPVSIKEKTKGGILLPNSTKDDMSYLTTIGKVLKIGDYVCYAKHAGQKIQYKNVKMILLYDDQVIMKVQDPKFLDPTFNLTKYST
jgi:co-chaperonin GroES (HSP10)